MPEEDPKQTVADKPDAESPETSAGGGGAQEDDLDALLDEFGSGSDQPDPDVDSGKGGQQDKTKTGSDDDTAELVSYVREKRAEEIEARTNQDIRDAAQALREGWDDAPPARLLEGEIWRAAGTDRRFLNAFQNRGKQPDQWKRILAAKQKELQREVTGEPDQESTADRDAVTSAVRASHKAPQPADGPSEAEISAMDDQEFERLKRSML